jgi:cullin 3
VLTTSHWPPNIIAPSPLIFPSPLTESTTVFQTYYDSRHSGRRLTWQGNLGTADVKVRLRGRSIDVNCSTQALVVLLAFEEVEADETLGYQVRAAFLGGCSR